jgi:hypothetical protein
VFLRKKYKIYGFSHFKATQTILKKNKPIKALSFLNLCAYMRKCPIWSNLYPKTWFAPIPLKWHFCNLNGFYGTRAYILTKYEIQAYEDMLRTKMSNVFRGKTIRAKYFSDICGRGFQTFVFRTKCGDSNEGMNEKFIFQICENLFQSWRLKIQSFKSISQIVHFFSKTEKRSSEEQNWTQNWTFG